MKVPEIIEKLGGRRSVSEITGAKPNAITQWRRKGIPPVYWHVLVKAAEERHVPISFALLARTRGQASPPHQVEPPIERAG
jgi:integrase